MTLLEAIILGIIQGLTEFLPISSSGHLVLGQYVLDVKLKGNSFEIVTHLGTLVSVLCIFWKEILSLTLDITDKNNRKYIDSEFASIQKTFSTLFTDMEGTEFSTGK